MRSAILMGSVAAVAFATPAFALPDRYEQGYSCTGQGAMCTQQQMRMDDGNRFDEKSRDTAINGNAIDPVTGERSQSAARASSNDSFGSSADDDEEVGDEIENTADEAGDEIENAADEAGDEISDAADDVGDAFD
jgi:hypothetical protein